ncbi:MAG: hypothetical protein QXG39_10245 [Candidatus Aenigmatarchaeota archaeon]
MEQEALPDVKRVYQAVPAIEQMKLLIIQKLNILYDSILLLFQNKMINRQDDEVVALVKSSVVSLYLLLKPKILEYYKNYKELETNILTKEQIETIFTLDNYILNPSKLTIKDAIIYADYLNAFCQEYGITKLTYFAGTTKESDIYQV